MRAENGTLVVGAAVTHRELERSAVVAERLPALARMERDVANLRVREVGTLGGNLCFSDPHSDPATFLLAVDAEVECRRGGGRGTAAADRRLRRRAVPDEPRAGRAADGGADPRACPRARRSPTRSSPSTSGRPPRSPAWRGSSTASWPRLAWPSGRWVCGLPVARGRGSSHRHARRRPRRRRAVDGR